jgi:nucleoid-associated protein YgaU
VKKRQLGLILTLSILLSSCGLIDKFKSSEDSTDSIAESSKVEETATPGDDLFTNLESTESKVDAPTNITAENTGTDAELKELQNEFNTTAPTDSSVAEVKTTEATPIKVKEEAPVVDHSLINESENMAQTTGAIKNYKVKNGETLMQIAFRLYGDISKWKDLKELNGDKLSSSSRLKAGSMNSWDYFKQCL